jgi:hypothetical protein
MSEIDRIAFRLLVAAAAAVIAACAASPSTPPTAAPAVPSADRPLTETERLGRDLYRYDTAAWVATDAAMPILRETGTTGWIVVPIETGLLTRFVNPCDAGVCAVAEVRLDADGRKPAVDRVEPPLVLSAEQRAMWAAREVAIAAMTGACSETYNPVILPDEHGGERVWRVYLLAATTDPDVIVVGGHHRIVVSGDGRTVIENTPLSRSCLTLRMPRDGMAIPVVSHVLGPEPIETHVFLQLSLDRMLFVSTEAGAYGLSAGRIERMDSK